MVKIPTTHSTSPGTTLYTIKTLTIPSFRQKCAILDTMVQFNEDDQIKRIKDLRAEEEEDLVAMLARQHYGIGHIDLSGQTISNDALRLIEEKDARECDAGPYKLTGKKIWLAVRSPVSPGAAKAKKILEEKDLEVTMMMASERSLQKIFDRYKDLSFATVSRTGGLDISADVLANLSATIKTLTDAEKAILGALNDTSAHHLSRILEIVIGAGIGIGASDIHVEPLIDKTEIRFRLDGILHIVATVDAATYKQINTRIKLLSGLKLTIAGNAQDGRFSAFLGTDEISFRTSLMPGAYGESIVLRILNPKSIHVQLESLGISQQMYDIFTREIEKPHGMVLLTGPTGSGKTTTLYAFLQKIFSTETKVITIEDPIEYHLPGITQTQVDHKKNYTFLEGLRSALRQDPDVIMVGEIRDPETAKIAVESALTGHLVFSTLHTNNACGVIPRFIDLDVNAKILVSALSLSIAQRLIRTLCKNCKYERPIKPEETAIFKKVWDDAEKKGKNMKAYNVSPDTQTLWSGKGCDKCNGTGYKGRLGIYEVIQMDSNIEKIITENPTEREIKIIADKQGTLDMQQDGLIKILQGITDYEEVQSVVDFNEYLTS